MNFVLEQDFYIFKKIQFLTDFYNKKFFRKKKFVLEREISTSTTTKIFLVLEVRGRSRANFIQL